mmetsp:Transcript_20462/g.25845  ORF Transcript_20462/g.25845 Transcript_20462/m.25845 type:complete len:451 (-) Transcript_20462:248-1600(-)
MHRSFSLFLNLILSTFVVLVGGFALNNIIGNQYLPSTKAKSYPGIRFDCTAASTCQNPLSMSSAKDRSKVKKERVDFNSLEINQMLKGKVVQLFQGRNGPKAWFDINVYRPAGNGTTRFVNAMLRIDKEGEKAAKRVILGAEMPVYISEIQKASGRLVCSLSPKEVMSKKRKLKPKFMLSELKTGQKLMGEVKDVLPYAAFIDCGIGVEGRNGRIRTIDGILHLNDLGKETALSHQVVRSADIKQIIEKGIDIEVYIKKASPKSAQVSFTLQPEGIEERLEARRKQNRLKWRRKKARKKLSELQIGSIRPAKILEVRNYGFIVDTGARRQGLIHLKSIKKVINPKDPDTFVDLLEHADPGDWVKAKVESTKGDKLYMEFVSFEETFQDSTLSGQKAPGDVEFEPSPSSAPETRFEKKNASDSLFDEEPMSMSALFDDDDDDDDDYYDEYD